MATNTNFSNSNTQIDTGVLPIIYYPPEIVSQPPNHALIPRVTIIASCCYCWVELITRRELRSDSLIDRGASVYEQ
jgi:hypothetical protein